MFRLSDNKSLPAYLHLDIDRHIKWIFTKFRFGISDLLVHKHRYIGNNNMPMCPLCKKSEDNEIHFVLSCTALQPIRNVFISPKFYRAPNAARFSILMASQNSKTVKNLLIYIYIYIYKAFKMRETLMS